MYSICRLARAYPTTIITLTRSPHSILVTKVQFYPRLKRPACSFSELGDRVFGNHRARSSRQTPTVIHSFIHTSTHSRPSLWLFSFTITLFSHVGLTFINPDI